MQSFRKLQNALDCERRPGYSIYQYGIPARRFLVASERDFFNKYMKNRPYSERNFYEVIRADTPCDLIMV